MEQPTSSQCTLLVGAKPMMEIDWYRKRKQHWSEPLLYILVSWSWHHHNNLTLYMLGVGQKLRHLLRPFRFSGRAFSGNALREKTGYSCCCSSTERGVSTNMGACAFFHFSYCFTEQFGKKAHWTQMGPCMGVKQKTTKANWGMYKLNMMSFQDGLLSGRRSLIVLMQGCIVRGSIWTQSSKEHELNLFFPHYPQLYRFPFRTMLNHKRRDFLKIIFHFSTKVCFVEMRSWRCALLRPNRTKYSWNIDYISFFWSCYLAIRRMRSM